VSLSLVLLRAAFAFLTGTLLWATLMPDEPTEAMFFTGWAAATAGLLQAIITARWPDTDA
jgi:hypothetical protein